MAPKGDVTPRRDVHEGHTHLGDVLGPEGARFRTEIRGH